MASQNESFCLIINVCVSNEPPHAGTLLLVLLNRIWPRSCTLIKVEGSERQMNYECYEWFTIIAGGKRRHTSSALPLMGLDGEQISQVCISKWRFTDTRPSPNTPAINAINNSRTKHWQMIDSPHWLSHKQRHQFSLLCVHENILWFRRFLTTWNQQHLSHCVFWMKVSCFCAQEP